MDADILKVEPRNKPLSRCFQEQIAYFHSMIAKKANNIQSRSSILPVDLTGIAVNMENIIQ